MGGNRTDAGTILALALAAALAGCGGGDTTAASPTPAPPSTPSPPASPTPPSSPAPGAAGMDVLTYKYDVARSGLNASESTLTPSNVSSATFGLQRTLGVDGKVDGQPLYLAQLSIMGAMHNVVYVVTENDSVYAFDVDTGGAPLWQTSLLGSGETVSDSRGCGQVTPTIGITSTPVIDRSAGAHGVIYVVAMSLSGSAYHQRLHALDVTTGAEVLGGPTEITATYPAAGGSVSFSPGQYEERAALLLANGVVYTSWTSHCDIQAYTGWIIGFDQTTLARTRVLNVAPNSAGTGPAIWMAGGGPALDASGYIYLLTGNGAFEETLDASGFPSKQDYGNSFLKISTAGGSLAVSDYFAMSNEVSESNADQDLGSGGEMLLPDLPDSGGTVRHLVVGAGKDGKIYLVNRDAMGKFNAQADQIWQELPGVLPGGVWGTPAYFNNTIYYGDSGGTVKAFALANAMLSSSPVSQSSTHFTYPGSAPSVSANGTANAIVWAHENSNPAVLHALDATNLARELYNSNQAAGGRDQFGPGNKFITPVVTGGRVLVGTTNGVAVFGLLQ